MAERVVRLADPVRDIVLRAGDSLLLEPRSGFILERVPKSEVEELMKLPEEFFPRTPVRMSLVTRRTVGYPQAAATPQKSTEAETVDWEPVDS